MGFQLLDAREFHHRCADVLQTFVGKVRRGDVLDVGAEVDARVLLCVAESRCCLVSLIVDRGGWMFQRTYAKSGSRLRSSLLPIRASIAR